jgi:hypothetical protein
MCQENESASAPWLFGRDIDLRPFGFYNERENGEDGKEAEAVTSGSLIEKRSG